MSLFAETKAQVDAIIAEGGVVDGCTKNELAVLKNMNKFEHMDQGIETAGTWGGSFADGVQEYAGVSTRGVGGVVGSLVKKGFIKAYNDGEDNVVDILPKGIAAFYVLNPDESN